MKVTIFLFLLGVIFLSSCSLDEQIQENKEIIETIEIEPKGEAVVQKPAEIKNKSQIILEPEQPEIILSPEEQVWRNRIESALAPTSCPEVSKLEYPSSYYQGPLTDTHLHIPSIPDWSAEEDTRSRDDAPEGRFGGPQALLGWNVKMSEIACTLKQEGTQDNFAFFPAYEGEISVYQLEMWNRAMQQYPNQFTPFIMSSGNDGEPDGFPTV